MCPLRVGAMTAMGDEPVRATHLGNDEGDSGEGSIGARIDSAQPAYKAVSEEGSRWKREPTRRLLVWPRTRLG